MVDIIGTVAEHKSIWVIGSLPEDDKPPNKCTLQKASPDELVHRNN